jgi:hypothetical protein
MLKELSQGVSKFFTNERILVLVIFLILVWGLLAYSGNKSMRVDTFGVSGQQSNLDVTGTMNPSQYATNDNQLNNTASSVIDNVATTTAPHNSLDDHVSSDHANVANPSDLLPNDENSQWSALNPNSMKKGDALMPDLLQAGYHIGLDTIGQTLRNANLQLRSDPIIPKTLVGPWNQSTIEPDLGRVPLEIGGNV